MSECACQGSGVVLVEGPCDAAPAEAPCACLTAGGAQTLRKLSQAEYGFTAGGSLANGALYVDADGRVFFLTDAEAQEDQP